MNTNNRDYFKSIYRTLWKAVLTIGLLLPFIYVWNKKLNVLLYTQYLNKGNILMWLVYGALEIVFLHTMGGYKIGLSKKSNIMISQTIAMFGNNVIEILITILMVGRVIHIPTIVVSFALLQVVQMVMLFLISNFGMDIYRYAFPPFLMIQICGDNVNDLPKKMNSRGDKYNVEGELDYREDIEVIRETISRYDAVLINDVPSQYRNRILKACYEMNKRVYFTPKISDIIIKGSDELNLFDTPLYFCRNAKQPLLQRFVKRVMDIVISFAGIIISSPIMLFAALAIYAYDRGPVFYRQTRCTIGGKEFKIYKFRSMIVDAEKDGKARLATENDDRITPVGKFIRATRIDELPQFFNIFVGDMSVVGPRPERPEIIEEYCKEVPEFAYRTKVKAGLTGYAQVYGKYNTTSYDKLKLDLIYVNKNSILLDIQLILLTLKVIFLKESTEGLEDGNETAGMKGKKNDNAS